MRKNHSCFKVTGKVQGVMFRQTFIRACQSRGLKGAASNLDDGTVSCYLSGSAEMIDDLIAKLLSGNEINSWGACVDKMIPISDAEGIPFENHQVTTINVDSFNWNSNIDMHL
jgi:acylphosphatase